jgi:DNA-binding CsgD family transcriptional regulator
MPQLTARETEVLLCAAKGMTAAETGDHLKISSRTVEIHVRTAKQKLKSRWLVHAVALAMKQRIIRS